MYAVVKIKLTKKENVKRVISWDTLSLCELYIIST